MSLKEWTESPDSGHEIIFDDDCITLELPKDQPQNEWEVQPARTPLEVRCKHVHFTIVRKIHIMQIKKLHLENLTGTCITPCCNFYLNWNGSLETAPDRLFYKVDVKGTTNPDSYFVIHVPRKIPKAIQETSITQSTSARRHELVSKPINAFR